MKKLIKKGEYGIPGITRNTINWSDPNIYNQLMKSVGMDFSQPSTFSSGLFNSKISASNNLPLPKANMENVLSNSGLGVPQSPDTNKIVSDLNVKLNDKGFQDRMSKGQKNYAKEVKWDNFKKKTGDVMNSDVGIQAISQIGESVGNLLPNTNDDKISQGIDAGLKGAAKLGFSKEAMAATGGTSAVVGGVIYGADALNKGIGALTNGATSLENSTNLFDSVSGSMLGIVNPIMLANKLTKKKIAGTSDYASSQAQSSSYADSGRVGKAEIGGISNLFSNIFGRDLVAERKAKVNKIDSENIAKIGIIKDNKQQLEARTQAIGNVGMTNQQKLLGGQNYSVLTAKKGATLQDIRNYIKTRNIEKEVYQNPNLDDNLEKIEVSKFQNGGSLIPSGALHKNKHKLESINPELDGEITKKGIPVISYAEKGDILEYEADGETPKVLAEGGEIIQHAEIEKDEVILNLSLTKKLIELMKKDTPEAMIEAGKILARELMEDTTDNTGLLEKTIGNEN